MVEDPDYRQWLAAILAADVAGYSGLMAADEHATLRALDAARDVCRQHITAHQGRVVDMAGDSVLAVFGTAGGAVAAALAIQRSLTELVATATAACRLRLRIGVHLGDVIEKPDGTVYGDGVNTAARLQALAEPGGITVSEAIRDVVRGKVSARFIDAGQQHVKNLPHPVHAFHISLEGAPPFAAGIDTAPNAADSPTREAYSVGESASEHRKRAKTILLVDDHALFREGLAELLKAVEPSARVLHANDGEAAIQQISRNQDIDLILLDLHMPGVSGLTLLVTLKDKLPEIPIVVLSADDTPKAVLAALDQRAMGYITKSTPWAVMIEALRLVIAGGVYLPSSVLNAIAPNHALPKERQEARGTHSDYQLNLTSEQLDVLRCVLRGMSEKFICDELGVAQEDIVAVLRALQAQTRTEALIEASRRRLQLGG